MLYFFLETGIFMGQGNCLTELTNGIFIDCNGDQAAHADTFQAKIGNLNPITSILTVHIFTVHKIKG